MLAIGLWIRFTDPHRRTTQLHLTLRKASIHDRVPTQNKGSGSPSINVSGA